MGIFDRKKPKKNDLDLLNSLQDEIKNISKNDNPENIQMINIFCVPNVEKGGFETTCAILGNKRVITKIMVEMCDDSEEFNDLIGEVYAESNKKKRPSNASELLESILKDGGLPSRSKTNSDDILSDTQDQEDIIRGLISKISKKINSKGSDPSRFSGDIDSDD